MMDDPVGVNLAWSRCWLGDPEGWWTLGGSDNEGTEYDNGACCGTTAAASFNGFAAIHGAVVKV
jgi:hypothetical protein